MKIKKLMNATMVTAVAFMGLSLGAPASVNAASWHKGAPKALIGKYKKGKNSYKGRATWVRVYVNKKYYEVDVHDSPSIHVKKISYKKVGKNAYKLRGTGVHSGYYLGGKESITMKKSGHSLKIGKMTLHKY